MPDFNSYVRKRVELKKFGVQSFMQTFVTTALFLAVSITFGAAQDRTKPEGEYDVKRCGPKVVSRGGGKSPEFHIRKGDTYKNSPVVAFEILETGETAHAVLNRSSGLPEVDNYAMKSVQGLKFNKRPGCGVIESSMDITIDFK